MTRSFLETDKDGNVLKKDKNNYLAGNSPMQAAMKLGRRHNYRKNTVYIKETTQGSKGRIYCYKLKKEKVDPVSVNFNGEVVTFKSKSSIKSCGYV